MGTEMSKVSQQVLGGVVGGPMIYDILKGPEMPSSPDYVGAANATAAGNLKIAQATAAANRVNQFGPQGSLQYSQSGVDSQGNPIFNATQTYSPEQQKIYEQQAGLSQGMLGAAQGGMQALTDSMGNPTVDQSQLAQIGINPGENYSDAMMRQLQPSLDRTQSQLNQNLANQGIGIGSEAYKTAQQENADATNRARLQAITGGMQTGLAANQQGFNQAAQNKQMPMNLINALRSGSQVQGPNYVNAPQQATTQGADLLGAAQAQGQFAMNQYNAKVGQQNAMMGGLFQLGGAAMMSDQRVKENIHKIGKMKNGLNVYEFDYKQAFKDIAGHGRFIGVMAQEVEKIIPEAVLMHPTGYKMVNYSMIGG